MTQTLEQLKEARGVKTDYAWGNIERRLFCLMSKDEWYAFDIMRGRGHSTKEIIQLGLARLRYDYAQIDQRDNLYNEVGIDPVKAYVYMRGPVPAEFTKNHGANRTNVIRIVVLNIILLKDAVKKENRRYQVFYMLDKSNGTKVDTSKVYQSKKKAGKIDRWLLNHFELES